MKKNKNNIPTFDEIITLPSLFSAWREFVCGKKSKGDVAIFAINLYSNLRALGTDLMYDRYQHGGYEYFKVKDPKERDIHKASVRDRVVHHLLYSALYDHFDHYFIYDSYSCRNGKGTHRAVERFARFVYSVSQRNTQPVWILKCDIRKCFASVDHSILLAILKRHICCPHLSGIVRSVIRSFSSGLEGKGIPLGNLTSQLFINVYLHELDTYIKRTLGVKYYIRYADDFVIMANSRFLLDNQLILIRHFLETKLKMQIHPDKIFIKTLATGLGFLGWIKFFDHLIPRASTRRRMFKTIKNSPHREVTIQSYLGMLSHGNTHKLREIIRQMLDGK
ncbi:MAG: reverse transcriptase/maturase family protein [Candidatus Taylorbacteria bacterium]